MAQMYVMIPNTMESTESHSAWRDAALAPWKSPWADALLVWEMEEREKSEIRIRGGRREGHLSSFVNVLLPWPPLTSSSHSNHTLSPYYSMFHLCITFAVCASCITFSLLPSFLSPSLSLTVTPVLGSTQQYWKSFTLGLLVMTLIKP